MVMASQTVFASPSSAAIFRPSLTPSSSFSPAQASIPSASNVSSQFPRTLRTNFLAVHKRLPGSKKTNFPALRCALSSELKTTIDKVVTSQKVLLFMKGTKDFPQCGFSNTVVQILNACNVPFETINILENEVLRQGLKEYSSWPTFPQLYIDGEFFGGCDITVDGYKSGELQELLEKAMCS
ncbi:Monothiol glutaredoxin-S7, chloroplastic [Linum perenne]